MSINVNAKELNLESPRTLRALKNLGFEVADFIKVSWT